MVVVEGNAKLVGEPTTEEVGRRSHLLLHDAVILLLLGRGLETLPRELSTQEIHKDVCQQLEVVAARFLCDICQDPPGNVSANAVLTDTQVRVDGGVARGTRQVLVLPARDVQVGLEVSVLLGQSKVDGVDLHSPGSDRYSSGDAITYLAATFLDAHKEVVGLDITVNEITRVDIFDTGNLDVRRSEQAPGL